MATAGMLTSRPTCPGCGAPDARLVHSTPYSNDGLQKFLTSYYTKVAPSRLSEVVLGGDFAVLECANCGLLFQRDAPNASLSGEIYDEWITDDDHLAPDAPQLSTPEYAYAASEVMQLLTLQRRRSSQKRLKVLDFGMGWSQWLHIARGLGAEVYGMELSEPKRDYAKSVGIPLLDWQDLKGQRFDVIATEQVMEHVGDPKGIASTLVDSLHEKGLLKVSVPNAAGIKSLLAGWSWDRDWQRASELNPIHPLEHLNCFVPRALDRFGEQFGLKRIGIPLAIAYAHSFGSDSPKAILRNIARPVYRHLLRRGGYALFSRQ